jgi:hypothetical protein
MSVIFMTNYFFGGRQHSLNSEALFVIDFVNLKIKSA